METKDWILLIIPIIMNGIINGIILFVFQKIISLKLKHIEKLNALRDEAFISFLKKLQNFNEVLIQVNWTFMRNPDLIYYKELSKINESVHSIIQYYDTNKYDLEIFSKEYNDWNKSLEKFTYTISSTLTPKMKFELGSNLQDLKNQTQNLIDVIRKNY